MCSEGHFPCFVKGNKILFPTPPDEDGILGFIFPPAYLSLTNLQYECPGTWMFQDFRHHEGWAGVPSVWCYWNCELLFGSAS